MPRKKKEKIEGIEDKLEYLGLELDNIPKKLKEFEFLDFMMKNNIGNIVIFLYKIYKYYYLQQID